MAKMTVNAVPSNTNITVQDSNNIVANISGGNEVNVQVTPTPRQTIQINRGVKGADGGDKIGGYPVVISGAQQYDVLMFGINGWTNTPQTEIADGGNF